MNAATDHTKLPGESLIVEPELLSRHSRRGPRYTSYPPANHFNKGLVPEDYRRALGRLAETKPAISLYVHLPFCAQRCLFCACNVVVAPRKTVGDQYLELVGQELELVGAALGGERLAVEQLHLGGGTPTFFSPDQLRRLNAMIRRHFDLSGGGERAVEVDPRVTTREHLEALRALDFDRVSFGVQDFDPAVQEAVGRSQTEGVTRQLVDDARELGYWGVNLDLIYGLPWQTTESFARTLHIVADLRPDRIACFGYAHVPWVAKHQTALDRYPRPGPEERVQLLAETIGRLTRAGYEYIGLDHFAHSEDSLAIAQRDGRLRRNFQGYTTFQSRSVIAVGASAISDLGVGHGLYSQNAKDLPGYAQALGRGELPVAVGYKLSEIEARRRRAILDLMCLGRLSWAELEEIHEGASAQRLAQARAELEQFEQDKIIRCDEQGFAVTRLGRIFLRNVCGAIDPALESETQKYSVTV